MVSEPDTDITIKGTRKGLSVALGEGDWHELLRDLDVRLGKASAFFQGSKVNLHTGKRDIAAQELQELIAILHWHSVDMGSLHTASRVTAETAQALQVRLGLPEAPAAAAARQAAELDASDGVLVRRTLRSGQSARHPGHVVVIGDVNPGAEVIAGGDVVVWGKVKGVVHAGAMGDEKAIVCALELTPMQLRIAAHISVSPDDRQTKKTQPEVASVADGQIVVEPWHSR